MLLKKLIKKPLSNIKNLSIRDLVLDSRKVKKGDLFFALKGNKLNGSSFIEQAIKKGAKAIICSKDTNIKTGVLDPLGATLNPGKDLYFDLISNMAKSFKGC